MSATEGVSKTSEISIFIFGKPAWEMDLEGQDVDQEMVHSFEVLGDELKDRLHHVASITKKLLENGWTGSGGLYDIWLYKEITVERAESELRSLGIDPKEIEVRESEWDDEA
jgi:hypothetical protein